MGKGTAIMKLKEIPNSRLYFDFSFFFDETMQLGNLLIYGMGFQKSGYAEDMSSKFPKYKEPQLGGIIDEHILIRLHAMQNKGQLKSITFAYYSESNLDHYRKLAAHFFLENVKFIPSSSLIFCV